MQEHGRVGSTSAAASSAWFQIGGVYVGCHWDPRQFSFGCPGTLRAFACGPPRVEPDIVVHISTTDLSNAPVPEPGSGEASRIWSLHPGDEGYLFRFQSSALGPVPYKLAQVDRSFTHVRVWLHGPYLRAADWVYPLEYPLDELLLIHHMASRQGIEVHACGVRDRDGGGLLFVGNSGMGKTTMARIWSARDCVRVLSDDRIVVRKWEGRFRMFGTPWHGAAPLGCPESAPLRAVFFLRHGPRPRLIPVHGVRAVAELVRCTFAPFHFPDLLARVLALMEELVRATPCYFLEFAPHPEVREVVRRAVAG